MSKYDDFNKNEYENEASPVIVALIVALIVIGVIVGFVLVLNKDSFSVKNKKGPQTADVTKDDGYVDIDDYVSGSTRVSDDLDIWDEYLDTEEPSEEETPTTNEQEKTEPEKEVEKDLSEGGTKTKVVKDDGKEVWVNINKYLNPNVLDNSSFVLKNGRLSYYEKGEKTSYSGIIVDKNDDFVDFNKVKKDGIDFVLIKIGQRGYGTGNITIDERFYDNLKNAKDAGLHVGVLFSSQAVTKEEAEEEAQFVIDTLGEQSIDYPVCFYMDYVVNDKARIEELGPEQKGYVAKAFMDKIEENGINAIIYGDKEWLLCELNFTTISYYDILLDQEEDIPDFPYRFTMWKYATTDVSGVSGKSEVLISFVDYSVK